MPRENISAFTGTAESYPPYINISKLDDGNYSVTVRSPAKEDGTEGDTAEIVMTPDQFVVFMEVTNTHLEEIND